MGSLRDVSLGDIVTALGRYRPVLFTAVAILAALLVLPKPEGLASTAAGGSAIETPPDPNAVVSAGATAPDVVTSVPEDSSTTFSGSSESPSFSSSSFSPTASDSGSGSDFSSFDTTATTTFEPTSDTLLGSSSASESGPLRIVSKTWATRTAGTPLAKDGVPDGTLPVGVRVQDDKLSFVRLSGNELVLNLTEHPDGKRENQGTVSVQACPITTADWKDGEAIAITDIAYDTSQCAQGVRGENGIWQFDLGKFAQRSGGNGFALVPGEDAGLDYQVCFKVS